MSREPKTASRTQPADAKPNGSGAVQLKRSLGLWNGVGIIVGVIVGSGIFVSPRGVLEQSGSVGASLLVWSACGLLALLGALCFAELGTSIGSSGGEYTYINLAYGPLASFLYIWVLAVVIMPCSNAIAALTFANYVLQPLYPNCAPPEDAIRLVAVALLMLLVFVNCASVDKSIKIQDSFSLAKVLALVMIIGFGLERILSGTSVAFSSASPSIWAQLHERPFSVPHLAQAFYSGFFTYSGWSCLNSVTEEIQEPRRNLPRSIVISITLVTLLYILTNVAYFAVLSPDQVLSADAIVVHFGEQTMPSASWLMPLAVALSTMGGLNASIFAASRVYFAASRQGQLLSTLQMINLSNLTPIPSLLFLGTMSTVYLSTTKIIALINYTTFIEATFLALGVSTLLVLRLKMPELERPVRVPLLVPVVYLLCSVLFLVLPLWSSPFECGIGVLILLAGLPVYFATARWTNKPRLYQAALDSFNELVQKLTLCVAPDASTAAIIDAS